MFACITFHYVEGRLLFLQRALAGLLEACERLEVRIHTNATEPAQMERLVALPRAPGPLQRIVPVPVANLEDPYRLTWEHKRSLKDEFSPEARYTHFLYQEDDLLVTRQNLEYWERYRGALKPHGLYPSFFRVEQDAGGTWRSTDLKRAPRLKHLPKVRLSRDCWFLNLPNPYQGMYLFDRELAAEHLEDFSAHNPALHWGVREQAAAGQTYAAVPDGFQSRNVVPWDPRRKRILPACWIHHMPNNYAMDRASPFGKLAADDAIRARLWS